MLHRSLAVAGTKTLRRNCVASVTSLPAAGGGRGYRMRESGRNPTSRQDSKYERERKKRETRRCRGRIHEKRRSEREGERNRDRET